jgi:uncharacterized membrane protein (Fun14 family)
MELNNDLIINGGSGLAVGFVAGWLLKKISGILFKFLMVILTMFVFGLIYLQSIKVIHINEQALDNLMSSTYNQINSTIGPDAIVNPANYIVTSLGIPITFGIGAGFLMGWAKG